MSPVFLFYCFVFFWFTLSIFVFLYYSSDDQRKRTLEDLTKVVGRPLQLLFDDMMLLMSQCDSLDSKLINRMIMALTPKPEATFNNTISTTQSSVFSGIFPGNILGSYIEMCFSNILL